MSMIVIGLVAAGCAGVSGLLAARALRKRRLAAPEPEAPELQPEPEPPAEEPEVPAFNDNLFDRFRENYQKLPSRQDQPATKGLGFVPPARRLVKFRTAATSGTAADLSLNRSLVTGDEVIHEKFGKGVIVQLQSAWPETKALIDFGAAGKKSLLLKFAKLKKAV